MTASDDHQHIDARLRDEIRAHDPPFDPTRLIARVQTQLPSQPPSVAARRAAAQRSVRRLAGISMGIAALALVALVNIVGIQFDTMPTPGSPTAPGTAIIQPRMQLFRADDPLYRALVGLTLGMIGLMLATGVLGAYPQRSTVAAQMLRAHPWRCVRLGALSGLISFPIVLGSMLLPAWAVVLTMLVQLPFIVGIAVVGHAASTGWARPGQSHVVAPSTVAALIAVIVPVAVAAALLPWWWVLFFDLLALPGVGALVLSRAGTRVTRT